MYRTLAWYCLKRGVHVDDAKAVAALCRRWKTSLACVDGHVRLLVEGHDPGERAVGRDVAGGALPGQRETEEDGHEENEPETITRTLRGGWTDLAPSRTRPEKRKHDARQCENGGRNGGQPGGTERGGGVKPSEDEKDPGRRR